MADKTGISWTNHTWNPWQGCTQVTEGCTNCYMFRDKIRYGQNPEVVVRSSDPTFRRPRTAKNWKPGDLVFTCSWSDWFHPDADQWRDEAWGIVRDTPQYTYQILTKRPNRILAHLPADWGLGYPNVWLGVSVENQTKDWRIGLLSRVPAAIRFVSYEPSLGPLTISRWWQAVDWLIVGGESGGNDARPFDPEWAADAIREGKQYGIPIFVKQLGSRWARQHQAADPHGADPLEWPPFIRVQDYPSGWGKDRGE